MRLAMGVAAMMAMGASAHAAELRAPGGERLRVVDLDPGAGAVARNVVLARRLRLRIAGVTVARPAFGLTRLHGRFATAMVDYFPVEGAGFHVSAGTRFHVRRDFMAEADGPTRGLLFAPRGGGGGLKGGFKRFTPTATVGYTGAIAGGVSLGLETGVAMGRAFMGGPHAPRLGGGDWHARGGGGAGGRSQRPNPMLNMVLGIRF